MNKRVFNVISDDDNRLPVRIKAEYRRINKADWMACKGLNNPFKIKNNEKL
jgi:hypothetical protein